MNTRKRKSRKRKNKSKKRGGSDPVLDYNSMCGICGEQNNIETSRRFCFEGGHIFHSACFCNNPIKNCPIHTCNKIFKPNYTERMCRMWRNPTNQSEYD